MISKKQYSKYKKYLNSKEWKLKKKQLFDLRGYGCEQCNFEYYLDVHHLTYKNLYNEKMEDLQILCKQCHLSKHEKHFKKVYKIKSFKDKKRKIKRKKPIIKSKYKKKLTLSEKTQLLRTPEGMEKLKSLGYKFTKTQS